MQDLWKKLLTWLKEPWPLNKVWVSLVAFAEAELDALAKLVDLPFAEPQPVRKLVTCPRCGSLLTIGDDDEG